jgi:tight adherence protein B
MLKIIIIPLVFLTVVLISNNIVSLILGRLKSLQLRKVDRIESKLETMFITVNKQRLIFIYTLLPLILGALGFLFFRNLIFAVIGVAAGLVLPTLVLKGLEAKRKMLFKSQLTDALMIISSSLRGGLSLVQAIEVLVEEAAPPMSQEFGLVLRESKVGVSLDESLMKMYQRVRVKELEFVINSILVARETGGDLTKVLYRLSTTMRDNLKLEDNIRTLTLQGKLQGIIMSVLPFIFIISILTFNPKHFDIMLQSDTGKMLIVLAAFLQVVGIVLIQIFSKIRV